MIPRFRRRYIMHELNGQFLANLNPYDVTAHNTDGSSFVIDPEDKENPCWVTYDEKLVGQFAGIDVWEIDKSTVKITNLPEPKPNTKYIVSLVVKNLCPDRTDLLSPGDLLRVYGQPVGCRGLRNP